MHFLLSLLLVYGSVLSFAEDTNDHSTTVTPGTSHSTVPASTTFTLYDFEQLRGNTITQDPAPNDLDKNYNYIAPNEHFNHLFEACLPKEGGVYISVGTFRAINVGSSPKVSHLVMMDISKAAVLFNKINVQLIAMSQNRHEYLSRLIRGKEQPELEKNVKDGKISEEQFLNALGEMPQVNYEEAWKKLGVILTDSEWADFNTYANPHTKMQYMSLKFSKFINAQTYDKTIMGNDERFTKFKQMVLDKKVTIVHGDIGGGVTFKSLNDVIRKEGMKVAGVDMSNAPSYIRNNRNSTTNMINSLRTLPYQERGRILFTGGSYQTAGKTRAKGDSWDYSALNPRHLEGILSGGRYQLPHHSSQYTTGADSNPHKMVLDPSSSTNKLFSSDDLPCDE